MLDYEFDSGFMTRAAGPVFRHAADSLMDAFVRHAQTLPVAPTRQPFAAESAGPPP